MSRRESVIKAAAGALQPKALDLTQFRQRSTREFKPKSEDVAGALAFKASPRDEDGETILGDTLGPILLRLKYADQHSQELFSRAHSILLGRHGFLARKPSETMYAVALVALFEWLHDLCPNCRLHGPGKPKPRPCPECKPVFGGKNGTVLARRAGIQVEKRGERFEVVAALLTPQPGCPKCNGMGRMFERDPAGKGMKCLACNNSGRKSFQPKQRWRLVSDYLATAAKGRGDKVQGLPYDTFSTHWMGRLYRFLDVLRRADKSIAEGIDLGFTGSSRAHPAEEDKMDEPGEQGGVL